MRAVQWCALILGGEMPPDWQREPEVRDLCVRVLRAWCAANGVASDTLGLMGFLRRWGADYDAFRQRWAASETEDALARESWAGVLQMVRR